MIGLITINRYPDYYYAYVGIGQVADMQAGESLSYKFVLETARKRKNQEALQELLAIGEPPYKKFQDLGVQRKWLSSFGGSIYGEKDAMLVIGREYFQFPEYSLIDLIYRFPMGAYTSLNTIWKELEKVKPINSVTSSKVPLYFLTGRHDYTVPFELTEKLFRKIKAPHKKLIWFEKSAHSPNYEESDKFYKVMVNQVLKESYGKYHRE